nr:lamin tail domain-containing protein [Salinivirgaceae bacterium]
MKKIIFLLLLSIFAVNLLKSQIVEFDFNTPPFISASNSDVNLTVTDMTLSSGTISTDIITGTYFTDEPYIEEGGGWNALTVPDAKYFYIDISAQSGFQFSISNISFEAYVTSVGPSAISLLIDAISVDTVLMPITSLVDIDKTLNGYSELTNARIKIAGWLDPDRIVSGGGTFRLDNLIIDGIVEPIPANDSSSFIKQTNFSIPNEISSLANTTYTPIFEFEIGDSATSDGLSTFIDSIAICKGVNNQFSDFNSVISSAKLISNAFADSIEGIITADSILFKTPGFEVTEGLLNSDTCKLVIRLKSALPDADEKQFDFSIDSSHVYSNPTASKVKWGKAATGLNKLEYQIVATELAVTRTPDVLWQDSLFELAVSATDIYGNIDKDETGNITLNLSDGEGNLHSNLSLAGTFSQGQVLLSELYFTRSDTASLTIQTDNYSDLILDNLHFSKANFYDNFEKGNLDKWTNTSDWTTTSTNSIQGSYSLKHNLSGIEDTSYISTQYLNPKMENGTMFWRIVLANGNFNPTSSNRFWYYLMANENNLLSSSNYGYVVGVNFSGTTDSLCLWKVEDTGNKTLLAKANFKWAENDTIAIEIIRESLGTWQVGFKAGNAFNNMNYSDKVIDNSFVDLPNHGLVFLYSSTRAGLLMADNISVGQYNTPPKLYSTEGIANDTILVEFSEAINQSDAENIGNYNITSETDNLASIQEALFNISYPKKAKLIVNRLRTANYKIFANSISDTNGSPMVLDSISFSYAVPAVSADVVFTEVMFDTSPVVGLPETDFIEIYNRSTNPFNMSNWQLHLDGTVKTFPDSIIDVGEFMVITSSSFVDEFSFYGKTVGLISSSELTNSGKSIRLLSADGVTLDSIFYKAHWITDESKQDGGWSLERIDFDNLCSESINWKASTNEKGGTPCAVNSIAATNMDNTKPLLKQWAKLSLNSFEFIFNEEIKGSSIDTNRFIAFNPAVGSVDSISLDNNANTIIAYISDNLQANIEYELTISGFKDLCNNAFGDSILELMYHPAEMYDIVFNELMVDHSPSNGMPDSDYLELYNRSTYPVNLENWE